MHTLPIDQTSFSAEDILSDRSQEERAPSLTARRRMALRARLLALMVLAAGLILLSAMGPAHATTYSDNFSGTSANLSWAPLGTACMTAGSGAGTVPACSTPKDAVGAGALRLTPAKTYQTGAILSNFNFALAQGLQVTFTTYTYGGDKGGTAKDGADGIAFFLSDGTKPINTKTGASGGSIGYSCSNGNPVFEGLANAYLGVGIDEFGNFLNSGDNTNTGITNTNYSGDTSHGTNGYTNGGMQYQPNRIGLRGAGNTTWAWLQAQNSTYYSDSSPNASKTQAACSSGTYVSGTTTQKVCTTDRRGRETCTNKTVNVYSAIPYNYNAISGGYAVLPESTPIANEAVSTRKAGAWPITYKLQISPAGLLNFAYSYNNGAFQPVLVNRNITDENGPLPASFRFGFSAGTGGSTNVHEITCFQASPLESNSSASANTIQSGQVQIGTQVYLASYTSDSWWGSLTSAPVVTTGGTLSVSSTANWDASCVLTGGGCTSMGTDSNGVPLHTITAQGPADRNLITSTPDVAGSGQAFQWSAMTSAMQSALNGTDGDGANRLAWLRGDRTTEQLQNPPGTLRARNGVLGDIIDSSPTWVGAPVPGAWPNGIKDKLYPNADATAPENITGAQTYSAFVSSKTGRENVVYVGANDGYLHAFDAGSYNAAGDYQSANNTGKELFGYMPGGVLAGSVAKLTDPAYSHQFYVNASPAIGDLYYGDAWHTWLVSGVGTGGNEMFALDITDPTTFSESNASSMVLGDWTSANSALTHLAQTTGTPIIIRTHTGQWAIVFGNGINGTKSAGIYVGLVDKDTGAVTFSFLDTGVGSTSAPNGISSVTSADLDGDGVSDFLYAGDQQGNLWRWDITGDTVGSWSRTKMFTTGIGATAQPITVAPVVAAANTSAQTGTSVPANRIMVLFGTGQKKPLSSTSGADYATGTQTFYGIWDWNLADWNAKADGASQYAAEPAGSSPTVTRSNLLSQTVVTTSNGGSANGINGYRTLSTTNNVCWDQTNTCTNRTNNQFGWYFDFPDTQEQDIYNPTLVGSAVVVNTAIPPTVSALACNPGLQSGWTMAFNVATGNGVAAGFFPGDGGQYGGAGDSATVSGIKTSAVGTPTTVMYNNQTYIINQTVNGTPIVSNVNPANAVASARVSWTELTP